MTSIENKQQLKTEMKKSFVNLDGFVSALLDGYLSFNLEASGHSTERRKLSFYLVLGDWMSWLGFRQNLSGIASRDRRATKLVGLIVTK